MAYAHPVIFVTIMLKRIETDHGRDGYYHAVRCSLPTPSAPPVTVRPDNTRSAQSQTEKHRLEQSKIIDVTDDKTRHNRVEVGSRNQI